MASLDAQLGEGTLVGEYRLDELIGRGGFGTVYRAVHPVIGKPAAVKILSRQYSSNAEMVGRFLAEARAVNRIAHKNIVDIFSFGTTADGRQYYVMELLNGSPLDEHLAVRGALSLGEALPILKGVARAMDAAHAAGILHRDLKPANVFLSFDGDDVFPKLLDFGIAKLLGDGQEHPGTHRTETGAPIGTPHYMSPEQCRGAAVDSRTDVYAFGVMIQEILTGRLPFENESNLEVMMAHLSSAPPRISEQAPELGTALDEAVLRMLAKDPDDRPSSLGEALHALAQAAEQGGYAVDVAAFAPVNAGARGALSRRSNARAAEMSSAATLVQPTDPTLVAQAITTRTGGGRKLAWIAAIAAAAAVVAAAGVWMASSRPSPDGVTPAAPPPLVAAPAPPPAAAAPAPLPAPKSVSLTIASIPDGVEVYAGEQRLGVAPGPVRVPRGDAPVSLTFQAKGYAAKTVLFTPRADGAVSVKLTAAKTSRKAGSTKPKELEF